MGKVCRMVKALLDIKDLMDDQTRKDGGHPFELSDFLSDKEMKLIQKIREKGEEDD